MSKRARSLLLVVFTTLAIAGLIQVFLLKPEPSDTMALSARSNGDLAPSATEGSTFEPTSASKPGAQVAPREKVPAPGHRKARALGLEGFVRAADGAPIADATLSWTPFLPEHDSGPALRESEQRYQEIKAATLLAHTDALGKFVFQSSPEQALEYGSVVWVIHANWKAKPILLPKSPRDWKWPGQLDLQPSQGLNVSVVDEHGQPVLGAIVRLGLSKRQTGLLDNDPLVLARELLWFEQETPAGAAVRMPVGPGNQVLQAFQGKFLSNPWTGKPKYDIELKLLRSFTIAGYVHVTGGTPRGEAVAIAQFGWDHPQKPGESTKRESVYIGGFIYVGEDGAFGPKAIPLVERDMLTVQVAGFEIVPESREINFPGAGELVQMDFEVNAAEIANVLVTDKSGVPLEGAIVTATIFDGSGTAQAARALRPTDKDGLAQVGSLSKNNIAFKATLDGYIPGLLGFDLPPAPQYYIPQTQENDPFVLTLEPARRISGRVLKDGQPVESFRLTVAESGGMATGQTFSDKAGKFELMLAQGRELSLLATAQATPQSDTQSIPAGSEDVDGIEFELPAGVLCVGTLRDAKTDAPVSDVQISVWTTLGPDLSAYRGDVYEPDAEGRFEIPGMLAGRGALEFMAPGYTPLYLLISDKYEDSDQIEMGDLRMIPTATARVRVVGYSGDALSEFRIWGSSGPFWDPMPLESDGTKLMEGVPANRYVFFLRAPDGTTLSQCYTLESHATQDVIFDLGGGTCAVDVRIDWDSPGAFPEPLTVEVSLVNAQGTARGRMASVPPEGVVTFENLPAGETVVVVSGTNRVPRDLALVNLTPGARAAVQLNIENELNRLRILDHQHNPVQDTRVVVSLPGNRSGWQTTLITDALGELSLGTIEGNQIVLTLSSTVRSLVMGKHVAIDQGQTTVLVLDEPVELALEVSENGQPCPGTTVYYTCVDYPVQLWSRSWNVVEEGRGRGYLLQPGDVILEIKDSAYWPMRVPVTVTPGMGRYPLEVYSTGNIEMLARTPEGQPAAQVQISLEHGLFGSDVPAWIRAGRVKSSSLSLHTDGDGRLNLDGIPRGSYTWTAIFPGGSQRQGSAVLEPRGTLEIKIQ